MEDEKVDLRDYVRVVIKGKNTIIMVFLAAVISCAVVSYSIPQAKVFETSIIVEVKDADLNDLRNEIDSSAFLSEIINRLRFDISIEDLADRIYIEKIGEDALMRVRVRGDGPQNVVEVANAIGRGIVEGRIRAEKVQIIEGATQPSQPIWVKPNRAFNIVTAGIMGALLGVVVAFLKERWQDDQGHR